jgi:hypothetical protein
VLGDRRGDRKDWSALCAPNLSHYLTDHDHNNGLNNEEAAEIDDILLIRTNPGRSGHSNAWDRAAMMKN